MSVETKGLFGKEQIESFSNGRNEPEWVRDIRLKGLELAETAELPKPDKTKIDKWTFTQTRFDMNQKPKATSVKALPEALQALIGEETAEQNLLVQQDTTAVYVKTNAELAEKGVIFTDIQTALHKHVDLVKPYLFGEAVKPQENKLLGLHAALLNGGAFIYVPKNVQVEIPLQAVFSLETPEAIFSNHVIVVAEENSSVTYVENYISNVESAAALNVVAEVYAKANAKVAFGAVDNVGNNVTTYVVRRAHVDKDARIDWALGQMNDGNTVSENTTHLVGDGSWADTKTVSIGRGEQKQNFTTQIFHHGKHSEGHILKHGVMREAATSIFNGITKIEHGATKSNGVQTERVLMLSEKARGDANPILLIDEDDVTAGHAASVGQVDPLQMFYLMSRGISRKEAERLVIHGFLAPVVEQLPIDSVKDRLREAIEGKVR
ncbi:Fe-S cluster assembly protein SufD [Alkalihalobacillus sp. MEB130]|uniref:Fe-S cluster assembly protein SufD n=1 Tax=Alkalihalobacillus sp. MEB130 TaxID=2976704 RepID=UPI0028DF75A7|nr:Fe-S cluster assembly protein SufD [Alkalihalobacillus sp. MEB130]MDT8858686.1 Fe-S cluster assembly protein SufD [Alkalihalobacillus sp. MEB130]